MLTKILAAIATAVAPIIAKAFADKVAEELPEIAEHVTKAVLDQLDAKLPDLSQLDDLAAQIVRQVLDALPFPFNK